MKKTATKLLVLALASVITISCKKDNPTPLDDQSGSITMKIDGAPWSSRLAHTMTVYDQGEDDDFYIVSILGVTDEASDSEDSDTFTILMSLPVEKFNNPKGTYDIVTLNDDPEGRTLALAVLQQSAGNNQYRTYMVPEANISFGKVTITDFTIGDQTILGQAVGGKGYTHLKGTFEIELTELITDESGSRFGGKINLTEGKFDVKNQLNF